jgi:hypothetical protein
MPHKLDHHSCCLRRERLSVSSGDHVSKIRSLNIRMWVGRHILMEFKDILLQRVFEQLYAFVKIPNN